MLRAHEREVLAFVGTRLFADDAAAREDLGGARRRQIVDAPVQLEVMDRADERDERAAASFGARERDGRGGQRGPKVDATVDAVVAVSGRDVMMEFLHLLIGNDRSVLMRIRGRGGLGRRRGGGGGSGFRHGSKIRRSFARMNIGGGTLWGHSFLK